MVLAVTDTEYINGWYYCTIRMTRCQSTLRKYNLHM